MVYHTILNIVPRAIQWDLVYPSVPGGLVVRIRHSHCLSLNVAGVSVLVIYCCVTNHHKIQWLKTITIVLSLMVLWVDRAQLVGPCLGSLRWQVGSCRPFGMPGLFSLFVWSVSLYMPSAHSLFTYSFHWVRWTSYEATQHFRKHTGRPSERQARKSQSITSTTFYWLRRVTTPVRIPRGGPHKAGASGGTVHWWCLGRLASAGSKWHWVGTFGKWETFGPLVKKMK